MEDFKQGGITRAALGRLGFIGELYDARSESFSSRSIFKSSLPENAIECQSLQTMEFDYKFTENMSDYFDLFKVEAELQVGVLCGLVSLEGSGKFLTDQKKSDKIVSCSLICKVQTVCQKFFAAWSEILQHIDLAALEDDKNTHVIVEIYWGANCLLSLECFCNSDSETKDAKGRLGADLKNFASLFKTKVEGGGEFKKVLLSSKNDVQVKVHADIVPENGWPTSSENFFEFLQEVPKMLEKLNKGKGKPLNYVMIPLSTVRKMAKLDCAFDRQVVQVCESFLLSTVNLMDEICLIKRKFYDRLSEMEKYAKYVDSNHYRESKLLLEELLVKEADLKHLIADNWVSVRSGAMALSALIKDIETYKSKLNLIKFEERLNSHQEKLVKLNTIKNCLSKGIIYLGKGDTFSGLVTENPLLDCFVFVTSTKAQENELFDNIFCYFLTLAKDCESSSKFVVVDLDYGTTFLDNSIEPPKCLHLKGSKILSPDLYKEHLYDLRTNFAKPNKSSSFTYVAHKPGSRAPLEMICPNFQKNVCNSDFVQWTCFLCKSKIEYGFDDFFYCSCGSCPCSSFTFRCSNPRHGNLFVAPEAEFLTEMLSTLRPLKEMNLLILGQSGVGKSTWINSIVNYLSYQSFEDAEEGGVICTIPMKDFMFTPQNLENHTVSVGGKSDNEDLQEGNSATQCSRSYSFLWEDRIVRLIDTPGLGDTRGILQDKENILNVINHIENLKELHGVCILFKASDNRLTGLFSYCIKELLVHLHKSVIKNMVFCITNARNTFYSPGEVSVILKKIVKDLGIEQELSLGSHNMFFLENEAFLFLCSLKNTKIRFTEYMKRSFVESWDRSLKETKRLLSTIKSFKPHDLKETISLFNVRKRILSLTQPLAEISKTIQLNVTSIESNKKAIERSEQTLNELSKNLVFTEVTLEPKQLKHPTTVCTSPSCVDYVPYLYTDISEIHYKTSCHSECGVKGVSVKTTNNALLKYCSAMSGNICKNCGCSWEHHMHIQFVQERTVKKKTNPIVEKILKKELSDREGKEKILKKLTSEIEEYKKEQNFILKATAKFGMFLKQNAITVYNDEVAAYLEYLIQEEENKPHKTDPEILLLENMKNTLASYEEEVKIFDDVLSKVSKTSTVSIEEIFDLEKQLYGLKLTGETIRQHVNMGRNFANGMSRYSEISINIKKPDKNKALSMKSMYAGVMKLLKSTFFAE